MSKNRPASNRPGAGAKRSSSASSGRVEPEHSRGTRETIESIVVAIILAFLFRTFVAEAFVIPTGSMAPTLMGKHKDVECSQCGYSYRTGASIEDAEPTFVVATTCPICRFTMNLGTDNANHVSFTGDRILVGKFSYELSSPKRWDVIVFKFPGNAKQNYIKRLIGLPNETLQIRHGDIYVKPDAEENFRIARKPEHKLLAMMQVVHDSRYVSPVLRKAGWPSRWQPWVASGGKPVWSHDEDRNTYASAGDSSDMAWLRYQHIVPLYEDWGVLLSSRQIPDLSQMPGQLITDFYAYNAYTTGSQAGIGETGSLGPEPQRARVGLHWVGDLALEAKVKVRGEQGKLAFKLVESGIHFDCTIDVATGKAELTMTGGAGGFHGPDGQVVARPTANTALRGSGSYDIRMANVDDEIWVWIDNRRVAFSSPTTYDGPQNPRPQWSPKEYGDLAPAGVGSQGVEVDVEWLKVLRDKYYISTRGGPSMDQQYPNYVNPAEVIATFSDPSQWSTSDLFDWDAAGTVKFEMGDNHFFPLGDNSPQSKDARLWEGDPFVDGKLLTGKAMMIYWPHAWNRPVPFLPNVKRMGFIR